MLFSRQQSSSRGWAEEDFHSPCLARPHLHHPHLLPGLLARHHCPPSYSPAPPRPPRTTGLRCPAPRLPCHTSHTYPSQHPPHHSPRPPVRALAPSLPPHPLQSSFQTS